MFERSLDHESKKVTGLSGPQHHLQAAAFASNWVTVRFGEFQTTKIHKGFSHVQLSGRLHFQTLCCFKRKLAITIIMCFLISF